MDYVRMRHGNAVWHRVTGHELWDDVDQISTLDMSAWLNHAWLHTACYPNGYTWEGPRTELITADTVPGRLCVVCARKSERERVA